MSDNISRKAAKDAIAEKVFHDLTDEFYGVMQVLDELPSTDRKGQWIDRIEEHGDSIGIYPWEAFKCSECGHLTAGNEYNFCPHCGADMRGV